MQREGVISLALGYFRRRRRRRTVSRALITAATVHIIDMLAFNSIVPSACAAAATEFVRYDHIKLQGFVDHLEGLPEEVFFSHLRLTRTSFNKVLSEITSDLGESPLGRSLPHGPKIALYVALYYLGTQETYREISQLFGICQSTAHLCTQRVIDTLVRAREYYIKLPSPENLAVTEEGFRNIAGLPGVIGALDGCHVKIKAPARHQSDYINRKMEHSVNLLAVCSSDLKFIYVHAGFPGKAHDSRVLRNSRLWKDIIDSQAANYFPSEQYHLIGDSAFPLHTHLMVPFKTRGIDIAPHVVKYNIVHSKTRVVIENAFGFLKGRFRHLKFIDADIERISYIIVAACVLHNITIDDALERQLLENEDLELQLPMEQIRIVRTDNAAASLKREQLAQLL